jgi:hypothetical protein
MYFNQYFLPYYQNIEYQAPLDPNSEVYTNFLIQNPYIYHNQFQTFNNYHVKKQ